MASGTFFSFEGIDGSGKSTQARRLAEALRLRGCEVIEVREPGGTDLGERIRALLLDPNAHITPRAELLLFSAARAQLVDDVVEPALNRGAVVIADRFYDSSTAYQGAGRCLADAGWLSSFHAFVTAGRQPDRTYLIDLDPEQAAERRNDRTADRMERGGDAFYTRVREAYLNLATDHPARLLLLDGQQPVDALYAAIISDALRHLK